MTGLDTNVLVRYLVRDDPAQAEAASRFIKSVDEKLLINLIVLCEVVWVLRAAYGYSKDVIAGVVEKILSTEQLVIEDAEVAWKALAEYKTSRSADFSDCVIGQKNRSLSCELTVTFDRGLKELATFKLL